MQTTVINEIISFILGRKYYANIVETRGIGKMEICSFIFATKQAARQHRKELEFNRSFSFVETVSFRSRQVPPSLAQS